MSDAHRLWREKLDFLLAEEAKAFDPAQKFKLAKEIEEARARLAELEGGAGVPPQGTPDGPAQPSAEPAAPIRNPAARTRALASGRIVAILVGLVAVGGVAITALQSAHKATVFELWLRLDEVILTVGSEPAVPAPLELLASQLPVKILKVTGAESFEATLTGAGRAAARPGPSGTVTLRAAGGAPALRPTLRVKRPMRLGLLPSGRDGLAMTLVPVAGDPRPGDWQCEVPPRQGLELALLQVELAVAAQRVQGSALKLEPAAAAILFRGGGRRAEIALVPVLSDREKGLLASNVSVSGLSFYGFDAQGREQSYLAGGRILFSGDKQQPLELSDGAFLQLPATARLKLGSLRLADGDLELALAGQVSSLELGPTLETLHEQLPSLFVWLSTHQLPVLVFSALAMLVAAALSLFKLLGWLKKE